MRLAKVESIDAHVGKRLRQRRIELGMSQQKLSGVTGVSYQQIQKYERGTNRIGASMLWLLSDVLNIQPAYFFDGLSRKGRGGGPLLGLAEQDKAGYDADTLSDRETMELVKAYSAVADAQVRKGVRQMLGALAKSGKPAKPRKRRTTK
jgi:transcriptional regulator with XRE-family HTH domain